MDIPPIRISEEAIQRIRDEGMCPQAFLNEEVPHFVRTCAPYPKVMDAQLPNGEILATLVQVRPGEDIWVGISADHVLATLEKLNEGVMPMAPPGEA